MAPSSPDPDHLSPPGFGAMLRQHRLRRGFSQEALAAAAGLSPRAVRALEAGDRRAPYPHTIAQLVAALALDETQAAMLTAAAHQPVAAAPSLPLDPPVPQPLTPLFGRDDVLAQLRAVLDDPVARLVTVTGPGGVGKTRLGQAVLHPPPPRFSQVRYLVLASLTSGEALPPAVAAAFGLPDAGTDGLTTRLHATLGGRSTLLVLDNIEQLPDATPWLGELLAICPAVTLLITSRRALGIRGEQVLRLPPLAVPAGSADPTTIARSPSVRLFLTHAGLTGPFAEPDEAPADLPSIAAICRQLDGLPLAIELAASRVRSGLLSPANLLARLGTSFDLLAAGPSDLPNRQQTLHATIQWSYDLLAPASRAALRRLSVFRGGASLAAAEAVLAAGHPGGAPLDLIEDLVAQSLLQVSASPGVEPRVHLFAAVRAFAATVTSATERVAATRAHAAWFDTLAAASVDGLFSADQIVWQARLTADDANTQAALAHFRSIDDVDGALRLTSNLARFWWLHGKYDYGRQQLLLALAMPGAADSPWLAPAQTGLAVQAHKLGDIPAARANHGAAVAAWRARSDPAARAGLMYARWAEGYSLVSDEPGAALPVFQEVLTLAEELGADWFIGGALWGIGLSQLRLANIAAAREALTALRTQNARLDSPLGITASHLAFGQLAAEEGDPVAATAELRIAVRLADETRMPWAIVAGLELLGMVAARDGHFRRATQLLSAATAVRRQIHQPPFPYEVPILAAAEAQLRAALGPAFADAWATAATATRADAVALALA